MSNEMTHCQTCPGKPKLWVYESLPRTYGGTDTIRRVKRCRVCGEVRARTIEVTLDWADDLFSDE
jgi:hypothetical protein